MSVFLRSSHAGLSGHPGSERSPSIIDSSEVTDLQLISEGHFGEVWRAVYQGSLVVVKKPKMSDLNAQRGEFNTLSRITAHPHVLTLLGGIIDHAKQQLWLVSAYVPGGSLADKIKADPTWFSGNVERTFAAVADILDGLAHLHALDIVHRDRTPTPSTLMNRCVSLCRAVFFSGLCHSFLKCPIACSC